MPGLVKKRRTGRAVLAVGALVASVLAAGAAPAAAATDRADHATRLSACVGAGLALRDRNFTDVSAGHVFRDAINCVAYYGITEGTGNGSTYSPDQPVTRAQMAVFVARAAEVAGVDLGAARDAGFGDLGDTWAQGQDAINRLASNEMIASGGAFRPDDPITRAEMATFLIGLLVEAAPDVTRDSSGAILLGVAGSRSVADDRFPDTGGAEIAAIYELGITKGASPAEVQDDTKPPLDLNYEPDGTVDRGQMAAFITRALAHTPARPEGVTAQYDGADVIVSVRDDKFQPVYRAAVDVFWATADQAERAVSANGTCRHSVVARADRSSYSCEIDGTDPQTGRDGDARVAVTGLRRVPAGGVTVYAWTGPPGATVEAGTDLYIFDVAEGADLGFATETLVRTPQNVRKFRFGSSALYTLQLRDEVGNVATGVNGTDPARWSLTLTESGQDPEVRTLVSDSSGEVVFSISRGSGGADRSVTYTLAPDYNAPPIVGVGGQPAATGTVVFSNEAPSISQDSATVTVDARDYVLVLGRAASVGVTVTVLDQYGSPFPGTRVNLRVSGTDIGPDFTVDSRGSHRFVYEYVGSGETRPLDVYYGESSADTWGASHTVHFAVDAGPSGDGSVLAGDVRRREIAVNDGQGPVLLTYDGNDRFNLRGEPTTITVFEAALAEDLRRDSPGLSLEWSNYRAGSDGRVAEYDLN